MASLGAIEGLDVLACCEEEDDDDDGDDGDDGDGADEA